jgi:Kef-type K+ transport system membrane component KefB
MSMEHLEVPQFLGLLVLLFGAARVLGGLAQRIGQPAVLGELLAGVIMGASVLGVLDTRSEVFHLLAELGVIVLLFEIGLETDLRKLLQVGGAATVVAVIGVVLPFAMGYGVCRLLGLGDMIAIVAGASLTATSVGITARVLSDLGHLQDRESQVILGAAVLDDLIGLVILAVVAGLTQGQEVTVWSVGKTTGIAFGFVVVAVLLGSLLIPPLLRLLTRNSITTAALTMLAIMLALGMAWLASAAGSATIIGAFAAGLLLGRTPQAHDIRQGVVHLGHFFVPIFFVMVGTAVDVRLLNPFNAANHQVLLLTGLLVLVAVIGKFLAGYGPFWLPCKKSVIGVGMIPRGEVGLIFAQMGLSTGVFDAGVFSAVTLMVMATTFMAPPLLKHLLSRTPGVRRPPQLPEIQELVTEA